MRIAQSTRKDLLGIIMSIRSQNIFLSVHILSIIYLSCGLLQNRYQVKTGMCGCSAKYNEHFISIR